MKHSFISFFILAPLVLTTACGDKKGDYTPLTPDGNKQKLDQVGMQVLDRFKPEDQADLLNVIDQFAEYSEALGDAWEENLPGNANGAQEMAAAVTCLMNAVKSVVGSADISQLSALASPRSDLYNAARYYGVYTYNTESKTWTRSASSDKLELRFNMPEGGEVVATASASGNEGSVEVDGVTVEVPSNVSASVTLAGNPLCSVGVTADCTFGSGPVNLDISLTAGTYSFTEALRLNSGNGSVNGRFTISGEEIVSFSSAFNGHDMTDPGKIEDEVNNDDNFSLVNGAEANAVILNSVWTRATCTDVAAYLSALENLDERYSYSNTGSYSSYGTLEYNNEYCDLFNLYFDGILSYDSSLQKEAEFEMQAVADDYPGSTSYYSDVIIRFASDGSEYSVDSYFGEGNFGGLINTFESLLDRYEEYFDWIQF